MRYCYVILFLFIHILLISQEMDGFLYPVANAEPTFLQEYTKPEINYKGVEGNPFYYHGFRAGFIVYRDSMYRFSHISLDLVEHDIILLFNLVKVRLHSYDIDGMFVFNEENDSFDYFQNANKFDFGKQSITGFLIGQKFGEYNVYFRPGAVLKPINENLEALGLNEAGKIVRDDAFFIEEQGILKPANNKKQVLKKIDKRKLKRAESIIKKNKLKFNTLEDFQLLFKEIAPKTD